jgi:hypothetical protein
MIFFEGKNLEWFISQRYIFIKVGDGNEKVSTSFKAFSIPKML